jgi:hypothetical protein
VPDSAARQLDLVAASAVRDAVLRRIGDDPARRVRLQALAKVILDNVTPGSKFSLNDVRDHIPADVVRPQDRGPLMARLCLLGVLVRVGDEPSTAERTNGKPIAAIAQQTGLPVVDVPHIDRPAGRASRTPRQEGRPA